MHSDIVVRVQFFDNKTSPRAKRYFDSIFHVSIIVRSFVAGVALFALAIADEASAFVLPPDELGIVIHGGGAEYLVSLGSPSALLLPGASTTFRLNPPPGNNQFSLVSWDDDATTDLSSRMYGSSVQPASSFDLIPNPNPCCDEPVLAYVSVRQSINAIALWSIDPLYHPLEWETLGGGFPSGYFFGTGSLQFGMSGMLGSTMYLLRGDADDDAFTLDTLTTVGTAFLSEDGTMLTVAGNPVPLPAAVIFFGTGLAGVVGLVWGRRIVHPGA